MEFDMSEKSKFKNRLINETSPYLLQHAHNPVDWFPWGTEAFEKAKSEDKPIFLSIGYSACHWCHVMEHESFENEEIANVMNSDFVNIKVDREERPDLDGVYMTAVQMMTGHGGWPMSVFLDHEGKPFYGGTYFPPVDKYNVPAFPRLLAGISNMWKEKRNELLKSSSGITSEIQKSEGYSLIQNPVNKEVFDEALKSIQTRFDSVNGGFGNAPKFPGSMSLQYLLRYAYHFKSEAAEKIVMLSLQKMANGGIYDQIGGGFSRYSVDATWHIPHFEKMLYDNALLAKSYSEAANYFKNENFQQIAIETLEFTLREMTDKNGGFYSTLDADSEGVEGKFYVWQFEEIKSVASESDFEFICDYFDLKPHGNWEHTNVLRILKSIEFVSEKYGLSVEASKKIISNFKQSLFKIRENRIRPGRDEKILTGWNGLMISSLAYAGFHFNRKDFIEAATKSADWIWNTQFKDNILYRVYKDGETKIPGFIEDYGNFILALVELGQFTGQLSYIEKAQKLADLMIEYFADQKEFGFFFYGSKNEELIVKQKDFYDNAVPGGNSSAIWALQQLYRITGNKDYQSQSEKFHQSIAPFIKTYASSFGWAACSIIEAFKPEREFIISGKENEKFLDLLKGKFVPGCILMFGFENSGLEILKGKSEISGKTSLYICENGYCLQPVTDIESVII